MGSVEARGYIICARTFAHAVQIKVVVVAAAVVVVFRLLSSFKRRPIVVPSHYYAGFVCVNVVDVNVTGGILLFHCCEGGAVIIAATPTKNVPALLDEYVNYYCY